jgi:hypothetical protein
MQAGFQQSNYLTKPFHLPELEVHIQKAYLSGS